MSVIVVSGALANKPLNGGEAWVRLNWILGFRKLGYRVYLVEQISRGACDDVQGAPTSFENSINLAYFKKIVDQFGLSETATLIYEDGGQTYGQDYDDLLDLASEATLLINISGHLTSEPLFGRFRRRAYIDIDPGFTQFWRAAGNPGARLAGHHFYFTIGENIGKPCCSIPVGDISWRPTRQPVVLEEWPMATGGAEEPFTTIASWRGPYGPVEHDRRTFGLKVHEFRKFIELPNRVQAKFEIALSIHPAEKDLDSLHDHGWAIVDPKVVAADPASFRRYVQASAAEFSVAQGVYVDTECGWFSDRTVRYLASGKPALIQDTGFSKNYPVGEGLLTFRTMDDAVSGTKRILNDHQAHCRAARALAEAYFDSDKVLGRLLQDVGMSV
jgi:hypothetical protein